MYTFKKVRNYNSFNRLTIVYKNTINSHLWERFSLLCPRGHKRRARLRAPVADIAFRRCGLKVTGFCGSDGAVKLKRPPEDTGWSEGLQLLWLCIQRLGHGCNCTRLFLVLVGNCWPRQDKTEWWEETFEELLHPSTMSTSEEAETEDSGTDRSVTMTEVTNVVKKLPSGRGLKALGI